MYGAGYLQASLSKKPDRRSLLLFNFVISEHRARGWQSRSVRKRLLKPEDHAEPFVKVRQNTARARTGRLVCKLGSLLRPAIPRCTVGQRVLVQSELTVWWRGWTVGIVHCVQCWRWDQISLDECFIADEVVPVITTAAVARGAPKAPRMMLHDLSRDACGSI